MSDGEPAGAADAPGELDAAATAEEYPEPPDPDDGPEGHAPGAPDDQEMPLADHIEEMVRRLGIVVVAMAVVGGLAFPFADRLINFLWFSFLPGTLAQCPTTGSSEIACAHLYQPLGLVLARLKVSTLVGLVAALPIAVYETYLFMRPGLYTQERRYYLASVPTSLILAAIGLAFSYFLVLPVLFVYFTGYTQPAANVAFGLTETFDLIVLMLGFFALIFQIPLLVMMAIMMGLTTREWMVDRRLYFWGGFATVAFIFSPDPTGMAPFLVAVTMIGLFEGTLLALRWTERDSMLPAAEALTERRRIAWLLAGLVGYAASTAPVPTGYYGDLPAPVTEALVTYDLVGATPIIVGGGLVVLFEVVAALVRRSGNLRVRLALMRIRRPYWALALLVGYLGSPNPLLVAAVADVDLAVAEAAALAVGLVVLFEAVAWLLRRYHGDEQAVD